MVDHERTLYFLDREVVVAADQRAERECWVPGRLRGAKTLEWFWSEQLFETPWGRVARFSGGVS